MAIHNITKEKVEEVLKKQGFFTTHRYKYSCQKARSHMKQLVKEGIAVYDRSNACKDEVSISLAKMRKIVCCNGCNSEQTAWANDFPFEVCLEFAKRKNWEIVKDDCGFAAEAFIARQGVVYPYDIARDDVDLVAAFEKVNPKTHRIVEIPDNVKWEIRSTDMDYEWVVEKHREWR